MYIDILNLRGKIYKPVYGIYIIIGTFFFTWRVIRPPLLCSSCSNTCAIIDIIIGWGYIAQLASSNLKMLMLYFACVQLGSSFIIKWIDAPPPS
ncbi:hypothetical protein F4604DRAFT_553996 [Suillus subluteus]|nr:hypothetical protein F4604DRAFT_553996 [Suillus subluteus]